MPLMCDIRDAVLMKNGGDKDLDYEELEVVYVGVCVLNRKAGGYRYSDYPYELDIKTMENIRRSLRRRMSWATPEQRMCLERLIELLPKLVGARFRRER